MKNLVIVTGIVVLIIFRLETAITLGRVEALSQRSLIQLAQLVLLTRNAKMEKFQPMHNVLRFLIG